MDAQARSTIIELQFWSSNVHINHKNYLQSEIVSITLSMWPNQHHRREKNAVTLELIFREYLLHGLEVTFLQYRTVLEYKKDSNEEPSTCRPINLQPILPSKVFNSVPRNRIYDFCYKSKHIDSNPRKGFGDDISGYKERTESLTHVINQEWKMQRSLIITFLDLKNAFGEVSHDFLISVLKYHHIPDLIISLSHSILIII